MMTAGPDSRFWRRYLRISMRGLIILVLVVGGGMGWLVRTAAIQRDAAAAIKTAGGTVTYDWQWKSGPAGEPWAPQWLVDRLGVDFFGHVIAASPSQAAGKTDQSLVHVARLTRLEALFIYSSSVTDEGLAHLKGLTKLSEINLSHTRATDAGLKHLEGMTSLSTLVINDTRISDAGLKHLRGLTNLSILYIGQSPIGDAGLAHIAGLTKLTFLDMSDTHVTDAGLAYLAKLTGLTSLDLHGTRVGDAGLAHLEGLSKLTSLDLRGTQVGDAGLAALEGPRIAIRPEPQRDACNRSGIGVPERADQTPQSLSQSLHRGDRRRIGASSGTQESRAALPPSHSRHRPGGKRAPPGSADPWGLPLS